MSTEQEPDRQVPADQQATFSLRPYQKRKLGVIGLVVSAMLLAIIGGVFSYLWWGLTALGVSDSGREWSSGDIISCLVPAMATGIGIIVHVIGGVVSVRSQSRAWPYILLGWVLPVALILAV